MTTMKLDSSSIIKMNNQTIRELRAVAKERGLRGYYKLLKAELVSLLESPIRPPRRPGQKNSLGKVTVLPKPEAMDIFERQEMTKTRPVVKKKLSEWYDWLVSYVPKSIKEPVSKAFSKVKSSIMGLYEGGKEKLGLKAKVEEKAEREHGEEHVEGLTPVKHKSAMNGAYKSFRLGGGGKTDIESYIATVKPEVEKLVEEQVKTLDAAKVQMHLWIMWKKEERVLIQLSEEDMEDWSEEEKKAWKESDGTFWTKVKKCFNSRMTEAFQGSDLEELVRAMFAQIKTQVEHPALPKSGFTLDHIMHLDIDFHKLELTRGGSYIKLPEWIALKKAVINPKNTDEECFKWAVIAALHHEEIEKDHQRISKLRPFAERYNWEGLEFPMALKKIGKFEKMNPEIAVNVLFVHEKKEIEAIECVRNLFEEIEPLECVRFLFGEKWAEKDAINNGRVYIIRRSDFNGKRSKQVNLLMITDGENRHYTAVKSLPRLLSSSNSKGRKGAYHFCVSCLNGFHTESARDKHYEYCSSNGETRIKMPVEKDKWLKFHDGQCQFKVPFMLYADFESILKPVDERYRDKMNQMKAERKGSYTDKINTHVPSGWCVHSKFAYGEVPDPTTDYRGKDCVEQFVDHVEKEVKRLYELYPQQPMRELTDVLKTEHEAAEECHICRKPFGDPKNRKVRDHCHYTGLYRGAAHNNCNMKYRIPDFVPIVFHNLSGYDAHLFIKELGKKFNKDDIGVIAENKEKYISFSVSIPVKLAGLTDKNGKAVVKKVKLRFIDSCRFMASSLEKLAKNLDDDQCRNLRELYREEEVFKLMRRKGVYPYEYMDSWEKFNETELPSKEAFYSRLSMQGISDKDYEHAQKVWDSMKEKTLGEYHDVYLKTDVLLLADVFETFRETCLKHYGLDPAHFYTAPGLAWKAALKETNVNLELLVDIDMMLMFEKGIRGGITQAVKRYAKANNKYMPDYNQDEISKFLQYLDANNLYGWAMVQKLPTHGFRWIKQVEKFTPEFINKLVKKDRKGYILEVDIDYPKELHKQHNELPFLAERMKIGKVEKLVPNLNNKRKYVVHIKKLHQTLKHGLVLKKVHRVLKFEQSAWLAKYIMKNTRLRKAAKNEFEKDFFKLMNNSVFGKTMENIRNHRDMRLVTNEQKYKKYVMKPNFKDSIRFSENLIGVEMGKTEIEMNKPLYLGQAILDLSKTLMYEFHYDYMKPKYGSKVQLCYMDTDSFVYEIETEDFYRDIAGDVEARFDTSGYTDKRPLLIGLNEKVIGLMKDELKGKIMTEFVALRAKMYAYRKLDEKKPEDKKCKGTKKCVIAETLTFEDYKRCLFEGETIYREQTLFEHNKHEVFTVNKCKIALNRDDDKRIIREDGITTLAKGYVKA